MVSLGVYVKQWERRARKLAVMPELHGAVRAGAYFLGGLVLSAASLSNYAQAFAPALVVSGTGWPAVLMAAGSAAGYLLFWGAAGIQGVFWSLAALGLTLVFGNSELRKKAEFLPAALLGLAVSLLGLSFLLWRGDRTPVSIYLLRILGAALAGILFELASRRRDPVLTWCTYGLGVLALAQIAPVSFLNLGVAAGAALACGDALPGAALGGLALDLAGVTPVPMTAVLCLAYLLRLVPIPNRRLLNFAPLAVYAGVMALCGVWDPAPIPALILGGIGAGLLPKGSELSHRRGEIGVAQVRMELVSAVLSQTAEVLQQIQEPPVDEQAIILRAADRACSGCPAANRCREEALELEPELLHKPLGEGAGLPPSCRKKGRLLRELRRSQEQFRAIRADRDRRLEYRWAVVQQYDFLSAYLQQASDALSRRRDPAKPRFRSEIAVRSASRGRANGDRCLWFPGTECRYYVLLCDGMGSGAEAAREGRWAGETLKKLLMAGYPGEYALRFLNSLCALRGRAGVVTVDLAELRLDTGKGTLYKWGAAPSFLISRGVPLRVGSVTPPPGLSVTEGRETAERLSLRQGELLVLLSDGAGGEEAVLRRAWARAGSPLEDLAEALLAASDGSDDATVAVARLEPL